MAQSSWEADKMLDVYIHDYLLKRKLHASAKAFMTEGKVATDPVAIDCGHAVVINPTLMFNLKDRSYPELREKVLSGKISPERFCSMTAEELDEFMESLDTEPPFENLTVDGKEMEGVSDKKDKKETGNEKASSGPTSAEVELSSLTSRENSSERKVIAPDVASGECLWEGDLQLSISSSVSVMGLFRSGEKISTKERPGSIDIKGEVRMEAFEKFLQQIPM